MTTTDDWGLELHKSLLINIRVKLVLLQLVLNRNEEPVTGYDVEVVMNWPVGVRDDELI